MCPMHFENNAPHTWFDNWLIDWLHFPELFRYVPRVDVLNYKEWVESKFREVLRSNPDLINEIFE